MANKRVGGLISVKVNGEMYSAKGNFTYNIGRPKRDAVVGHDKTHGYKEIPQVAFIEGEITDRSDLSLEAVLAIVDATATLELANGKVIILRDAWYAGEGTGNTEEGNIPFRLEGMDGEEVR